MPDRRLLLLMSLCLWEGLVRAEPVTKVVRRRGLSPGHSQLHGVTNQRDQPSLEKNGVPLVRLKELISADKADDKFVGHSKAEQTNEALSVSNQEELHDFNAKYPQQENEDSTKTDSRVLKAVDNTRDLLETRRLKNNTKNTEILKRGRVDKGIPVRRKIDSSLHFNRTRYKSQSRFRARPSPGLLNNAIDPKGAILDSPRKLNLTGNFGVLKLISKDNLVRIVNSQLQNGLTFQNKISHSRKRDLIDMDHGQLEEPKIKRQDSSVSPAVHESDNHNKTLGLSVEPQSSTITNPNVSPVHIFRRPVSDPNPNSKDEEKKTEDESIATAKSKHHLTHVASTPQSELMADIEAVPFTSRTNISQESGQNTYAPGMEINVTQEPISKASDFVEDGHILQLRPNPDGEVMDKEDVWEPSVTWPLHGGHGLVFQEMEEDGGKGWSPKESDGSRSRSRRSWIWNQFFVIEEYAGPEPVLIGRLHTDMDRGDGRTKYVLRGEGAGSVFVIDEKTGNIHVTKPLDREEKDEYRLIATATDSQTERALEPSSQFIIRVQDINDNPPVFEDGPYSATVSEMANIGTSIVQVTATDADDPTYGNSARLVYTLVQGQPHFSVDPQTGILRTAVPDLDRETQDQYLVVLQAKDMGGHLGGLSGTTTVTVKLTDVNDNPPHFTQSE
ncbi:hypothetical protein PDJAM_G00206790 [Pangasius djambal]|uniref:Uncharacterized protein n=1 Tax=Pangasius djambal TaxID=1691987 RepID=A0ACC5Y8X3_9TELE|nr:hypothetical protein [Pangasius djambal]